MAPAEGASVGWSSLFHKGRAGPTAESGILPREPETSIVDSEKCSDLGDVGIDLIILGGQNCAEWRQDDFIFWVSLA